MKPPPQSPSRQSALPTCSPRASGCPVYVHVIDHPDARVLRAAAYRILALRGRRMASGMADPLICSPDPERVELLKGMAR
jgi:hypothetical protein